MVFNYFKVHSWISVIKFIYKENHRKWCEIWGGESPSYAGLEKCIVIWKITMALNFTEGKDRADKCYNFCVASIKFSNPKHLKMLKVFFLFLQMDNRPSHLVQHHCCLCLDYLWYIFSLSLFNCTQNLYSYMCLFICKPYTMV